VAIKNNLSQSIENIIHLLNIRQYTKANSLIEQYISSSTANHNLWHLKAVALKELGHIELCEEALKKSLEISPGFMPALMNLAQLYKYKNEIDLAIETYLSILKISSSDANVLFNLGVLLNKSNKYVEAEIYLQKAFKLNNQDINIKIALGQSYLNQEKFELAIRLFDQVLVKDNNNLAALNNKGIALRKLCRWKEAIESLQLGLNVAPNQIELIKNLASCYTLTGDLSKSKLLYKKALNLSPLDLDAHHWLNQLLWEQKDPEFLDSYRKAISSTNNSNQLMLSLGHKLYLAGEHKEARETLQKSLRINNNHAPTLIKLGVVLRELEEFELSQQYLTKAAAIDNSYLAQEELGISHLCLNQPLKAIKIFDLLIGDSPHLQGCLAYKATALKLLKSAEYDYLCNYEHVLVTQIAAPEGYLSIEDFNNDLVLALRSYHFGKTNPLDQSLVTGSQTSEKLFDYHVPIFQQLRKSFRAQVLDFLATLPKDDKHPLLSLNTGDYTETDTWSVILKNSGFHKNHHHPAGWYSGSYYAKLPSIITDPTEKQGWIKFGQPGFKMLCQPKEDKIIEPKEGMLIRFPSYFWHGTIPFKSDQERITVSGDIAPI